MSTDIVDKDLKTLRNNRWEKAFNKGVSSISDSLTNDLVDSDKESVDRKATIVIEHIIQASDISHTMQHWIIYRKWVRLMHMVYSGRVPMLFLTFQPLNHVMSCRIRNCLMSSMLPTSMAKWTQTLLPSGTRGKLASLTSIL